MTGSYFFVDIDFEFPEATLRNAYVGIRSASDFLSFNGALLSVNQSSNLSSSLGPDIGSIAESSYTFSSGIVNASIGDVANTDANSSSAEALTLRFFGQATGRFNRDAALSFVPFIGGSLVPEQQHTGSFLSAVGEIRDNPIFFGSTFGPFVFVGSRVSISLPMTHSDSSDADVYNFTVRDYTLGTGEYFMTTILFADTSESDTVASGSAAGNLVVDGQDSTFAFVSPLTLNQKTTQLTVQFEFTDLIELGSITPTQWEIQYWSHPERAEARNDTITPFFSPFYRHRAPLLSTIYASPDTSLSALLTSSGPVPGQLVQVTVRLTFHGGSMRNSSLDMDFVGDQVLDPATVTLSEVTRQGTDITVNCSGVDGLSTSDLTSSMFYSLSSTGDASIQSCYIKNSVSGFVFQTLDFVWQARVAVSQGAGLGGSSIVPTASFASVAVSGLTSLVQQLTVREASLAANVSTTIPALVDAGDEFMVNITIYHDHVSTGPAFHLQLFERVFENVTLTADGSVAYVIHDLSVDGTPRAVGSQGTGVLLEIDDLDVGSQIEVSYRVVLADGIEAGAVYESLLNLRWRSHPIQQQSRNYSVDA